MSDTPNPPTPPTNPPPTQPPPPKPKPGTGQGVLPGQMIEKEVPGMTGGTSGNTSTEEHKP